MKQAGFALCVLGSASSSFAIGQLVDVIVGDQIETGSSCSYFGESMPANVASFASDSEAETVVSRIMTSSGLAPNFVIRAAGVPNAAAVIRGSTRMILYDQFFVRTLRERSGTEWAPISVMAHEIAHHLNGHTLDEGGSRPRLELEADYYSGFVLQKMGATLEQSRAAMDKFGSSEGSATHPSPARSPGRNYEWVAKELRRRSRCDADSTTDDTGPDDCKFALDGKCDEPNKCARGTDKTDCSEVDPDPSSLLYCCDLWGFLGRQCRVANSMSRAGYAGPTRPVVPGFGARSSRISRLADSRAKFTSVCFASGSASGRRGTLVSEI
ncbi:MAG: hypothetical protein ACREX3_20670 [Gammaproteobacteria bacterium]